jgi:hypothetical protein
MEQGTKAFIEKAIKEKYEKREQLTELPTDGRMPIPSEDKERFTDMTEFY